MLSGSICFCITERKRKERKTYIYIFLKRFNLKKTENFLLLFNYNFFLPQSSYGHISLKVPNDKFDFDVSVDSI